MASPHSDPPDGGGGGGAPPELQSLPVRVITEPGQLPVEFLEPSAAQKLVIGFDCEGVDLCRHGALCIMQLAFPDAVYLVDAIEGGKELIQACKPALESEYVTKVIHDCKRDSEIAYSLLEEQDGKKRGSDDYISFVHLLADPRYCGMPYPEKEEVRTLLRQDPNFWKNRPLSEMMIRAATDDVRFLLSIHEKMMEKLSNVSLWRLSVRSELYCRCFCINDNLYADWPPLPTVPDEIEPDVYVPEVDILSVLDVPPGKMGRVIGRKGSSIMEVKQSCNVEIHIGGAKGPPDRVFIIGPVKEVRKAEAILRGRMLEY
uniref:3'-5' exonuclease domain-containing protein n=1 Tax=Leersia perrieri TaxID=77586 RepID=A0A0D9V238_9ORYZ